MIQLGIVVPTKKLLKIFNSIRNNYRLHGNNGLKAVMRLKIMFHIKKIIFITVDQLIESKIIDFSTCTLIQNTFKDANLAHLIEEMIS